MAARICRLQWGGRITDGPGAAAPTVEIWSNTAWLNFEEDDVPLPESLVTCATALSAYVGNGGTKISNTVIMDSVKLNQIDVATGLQITDPTLEATTATRGNTAAPLYPTTTSCRITVDDGSRNRKGRGGWFNPRVAMDINQNGRWSTAHLNGLLTTTQTLMAALQAISGVSVGIYSKTDHAFTAADRIRIGDVPDNIRTRKNAMPEVYTTGAF